MANKKPKILLVDDIIENIEVLASILKSDYEISFALAGKKALKMAQSSSPPDLILLDVMMPEMDGLSVCSKLKENTLTQNIPVIFVTARSEETDETDGFSIGAVDYITKPVSPPVVRARVKTHLSLAAARIQLEKQNEILQENVNLRERIDEISRHDLKSSLSIFLTVPEMLKTAKNLLPHQIEWLELLARTAERLKDVIFRSLDLYKMERNEYKPIHAKVNLAKIIQEIFRQLENLILEKKLSTVLSLDKKPLVKDEIFELKGEEYLYFALFTNLLKNAIEASPEGEKIIVEMISFPQSTVIIKNRGVIPPQIQGRFFQRYVTFGKEHGTGLGAYSANLMAKTLGGTLSFTSNEVDGTSLIFSMVKLASETGSNKSCKKKNSAELLAG
ncbi:MAG: hybrid sensor histidine kinase/response regulator [Candidatus Riflebacteria bacterium]|nr:hybrid sensor histidine kinase/response regulator [Candidatus Riflebacteria bacterium]